MIVVVGVVVVVVVVVVVEVVVVVGGTIGVPKMTDVSALIGICSVWRTVLVS